MNKVYHTYKIEMCVCTSLCILRLRERLDEFVQLFLELVGEEPEECQAEYQIIISMFLTWRRPCFPVTTLSTFHFNGKITLYSVQIRFAFLGIIRPDG